MPSTKEREYDALLSHLYSTKKDPGATNVGNKTKGNEPKHKRSRPLQRWILA